MKVYKGLRREVIAIATNEQRIEKRSFCFKEEEEH
jgi:hypothetical protein